MITKGIYMHINRILLISAVAALALTSCKGDETETLKYLTENRNSPSRLTEFPETGSSSRPRE